MPGSQAAWSNGNAVIPAGYPIATHRQGKPSFASQNSLSLTAIGVVAAYIVLAVTTHIVLLGIFPVLMSVRAIKRKEPLAPLAVVAAIVAVAGAFLALK
jgi:hypothetical protein